MSGLYQKASLDLLYDLINRDNPNLPYKVSADTFVLHSGPVVKDPTTNNGRNTQVVMRGVQGKGYRGLVTFNYNRIDFGQLFKDIEVVVTHYTATNFYGLIAMFNSVYGLAVTADEMNNQGWTNSASATTYTGANTVGVKSATASLAFIGSIPKFTWKRGNPSLETLISKSESTLPVIGTPAANTFDFSLMYRGMDFTEIKQDILNAYSNQSAAMYQALAAAMKRLTGHNWQYNNSGNQPFNIYSCSIYLTAVPGGPSSDAADQYYTDCTYVARIALHTGYCNNTAQLGNGWGTFVVLPYNN